MAKRIEDIVERLTEARKAYYESDSPLMTDGDFDALEDELRELDPRNSYFSTVGIAAPDVSGAKIRHDVPMLSMGKAKTLEEAEKWLRRLALPADAALTVQPKVDGLSAALRYRNGELSYVATRGDGETGQDIGHIASHVDDIPGRIGFTGEDVEIRGELHLPRDTAFDTGGKPLRNNCVGLINRKDDRDDLRHVRFLAYQIVWPAAGHLSSGATAGPESAVAADSRFASESGKIEILAENGFYTFPTWRLIAGNGEAGADGGPKGTAGEGDGADAGSPESGGVSTAQGELFADSGDGESDSAGELVEELRDLYDDYVGHLRDEWNFETDGLIIAVDDNRLHDGIDDRWVVDHHHHYALAFKPPSQAARTVLKEVVWQVSRQGNLSPVAVFEPLSMGGATLERASLHNAQNVRRLKLSAGDSILVERANDVIPYVRDNPDGIDREEGFADPVLWPSACPSCGSVPADKGVHIACPNPDCRARVLQSILYWVRQADMGQIALKTLEALYDAGKLKSIRDLYTLSAEDFDGLEGFGEKKIANFLDQAASARSMSAPELISRLGIPSVQRKSLSRLGIATMDDFRNFEDESYAIGKNIVEWKSDSGNMELLDQLLEVVEIREETDAAERKGVVCLTGKAPVPRKALTATLEAKGWTVAGAVTKETVLVVCDDPSGTSTKLKKAREAGIDIVTYEEFLAGEDPDS